MASNTSTPQKRRCPHSNASSPSATPSTASPYADRFIPSRRSSTALTEFGTTETSRTPTSTPPSRTPPYDELLRSELLGENVRPEIRRCLVFQTPREQASTATTLNNFKSSADSERQPPARQIPTEPYQIRDAPGILDDFYANVVAWSSRGILAVALQSVVYVLNVVSGVPKPVCDIHPYFVTSVAWSDSGDSLAVGVNNGQIHTVDVKTATITRTLTGHANRTGTLSWGNHSTENLLASGSRDKSIRHRDLRDHSQRSVITLEQHTQEVCGLQWAPEGTQLASGGNDNKAYVWDARSTRPLACLESHCAAVKALAWSPHRTGLLATGGGTADRCIRFWDTNSANFALSSCIDTGSQICSLAWSPNVNEIVSAQGYSHHEVALWRYPSLSKVTTLMGHTSRVLYLALSPSGESIVTGAGDETLRFWHVFPAKPTLSPSLAQTIR